MEPVTRTRRPPRASLATILLLLADMRENERRIEEAIARDGNDP